MKQPMQMISLSSGVVLRVDDVGGGQGDGRLPLVFSHCLGGSLEAWGAQVAHFGSQRRCVAYDVRGQGESVGGEAASCSMALLADDVIALLDSLKIDRCVFVGISMGGMIGQHAALKAPGRFAGLVLADTAPGFDAAARKAWDERIAAIKADGLEPLVETMMARWFTPSFRLKEAATVAVISDQLRKSPVAGYLALCAAIREHDVRHRLSEIRCPTRVVCGENDPSTPLPLSRFLADGIPGAVLSVIEGAHHLPNIEFPDRFNGVLEEFLCDIDC